jgi:Kdo2-lipid IVA lauroyltransferase/acyltransferase
MPSPWKRFRYRLERFGLRAAAILVPLLSRKACFHLANFLGAAMSIFDRHGRKVALSNLEVAFGDRLSLAQRKRIMRESFQHFARTMLDLIWSPRLTRENFSRYIEFENFEEAFRGDSGHIVACFHYSNFEWLSLACGLRGISASIVAQEFKNSLLDPIFKRWREIGGHTMLPRKGGIVRLYRALRRKGTIALLVDLTVPPDQAAVAIDCLGLKTSVTSAHAWLSQRTGAPILPAHCQPLPDGRYRIVFHPKIDNSSEMTPQQIAQACWNSFEPYLKKNPAPWLWMYKHWRYKPGYVYGSYPFYAHHYDRFDELVREALHRGRSRSSVIDTANG